MRSNRIVSCGSQRNAAPSLTSRRTEISGVRPDACGRSSRRPRSRPSAPRRHRPSISRSKRSPPAIPPAVLTIMASHSPGSALGKRTRSEPSSCTRTRRVRPSCAATASAMRPTARLSLKTLSCAAAPSVTLASDATLQRNRPAECGFIHIRFGAGIDHRAAIHDREAIAEIAGKIEILLDQNDGDVAEAAQIDDGAADILDDRGLDAFGRLVEQQTASAASPARGRSPVAAAVRRKGRRRAGAACPSAPETARTHRPECSCPRGLSGAKPVLRFSSTVSSGKISRPCGTKAMPARARS